MDDTASRWIVAAPLMVIGIVMIVFGWRGAARRLTASSGLARWWSTALLLPAVGLLMVAMGALLVAGLPDVALGLMYAAAGAAAVATALGAVRALRTGERRTAVRRAAFAVFLAVGFGLIAFGWQAATNVFLAVSGAGLLVSSLWLATVRWRGSDSAGRRTLLQSVALGVGLICQASVAFVPTQHRALSLVLVIFGVVSLLLALGLGFAARRARRSASSLPARR